MKKIVAFLSIIVFLFASCVNNAEFSVGDRMDIINKKNTPYFMMSELSAYKEKNNYIMVVSNQGVVQKLVELSPKREIVQAYGLDLVKCDDLNKFLDMNISNLKDSFGQPHVDVGSGFYIPAYITYDAYLICFELENDIVFGVIRRDLLSNKIVDYLRTQTDDNC